MSRRCADCRTVHFRCWPSCALEHCVHVRCVGRLQGMITYPESQRSRYRATLREMFDADAKDWGDKNWRWEGLDDARRIKFLDPKGTCPNHRPLHTLHTLHSLHSLLEE